MSPRAGLLWIWGGQSGVVVYSERPERTTSGAIRLGMGLFEGRTPAALISSIGNANGLSDGITELVCVGDAVPVLDWKSMQDSSIMSPTSCLNGAESNFLSSNIPVVSAFSHDYRPSRSWRIGLTTPVSPKGLFTIRPLLIYSLNRNQPGALSKIW